MFRLLYGGCFRLFLPVPFRHLPKSLALFRCHIHHHFIETVDGRIVLPVDGSIDVVWIALLIRFLHFLFLVRFLFSRRNRGGMRRYIRNLRCNLHFRFGRSTLCGTFLFRCLFLLGSFLLADFFGHSPKVKQGELHTVRMLHRAVWLYLRLFVCGLWRYFFRFCHRFGVRYIFNMRLYFGSGNNFTFRAFTLRRMKTVPVIQFLVKL